MIAVLGFVTYRNLPTLRRAVAMWNVRPVDTRQPEPARQPRPSVIPELALKVAEQKRLEAWRAFVFSFGAAAEHIGSWNRREMCGAYQELTQDLWRQVTERLVMIGVLIKKQGRGTELVNGWVWEQVCALDYWRHGKAPYPDGDAPPPLKVPGFDPTIYPTPTKPNQETSEPEEIDAEEE